MKAMLVEAAAVLISEGWLVMTKLSRAVVACIFAAIMSAGVASSVRANSFFYLLDNTTLADANRGPSLVSYGGTLSQGYTFGVLQGLSLSGTGISDAYSIFIRFYFDDVNASNTFQKILDFKNQTSDSGLYSGSGSLQLFASTGSGDPHAGSGVHDFANGAMADLLVTRNSSGLFSTFVNGNFAFSVMDTNGATRFSGPDNIMYFFMDDLLSNPSEAGTGFVDRIQVTTFPAAAVPGPIVGAGLPGLTLAALGMLGWWRCRSWLWDFGGKARDNPRSGPSGRTVDFWPGLGVLGLSRVARPGRSMLVLGPEVAATIMAMEAIRVIIAGHVWMGKEAGSESAHAPLAGRFQIG